MLSQKTARKLWHPVTEHDRELVLEQLHAVLRSSHFSNSKRYPALLRYVVEQTLEGNADQIKERIIGIEVFHRPNDYDTTSDTIVRYTAGEVRKRLAIFNHEHDGAPIEIVIPQGSYVPEFSHLVVDEEPATEVPLPALPVLEEALLEPTPAPAVVMPTRRKTPALLWSVASLLVLCLAAFAVFSKGKETALDRFWKPITTHEGVPLIVAGGVVFSPNLYSGVETAGKADEYPFVSMQVAAAMSRMNALLQQKSGQTAIRPANTTSLSDLRDRPVVLLGGYNNLWTLRLLQNDRFHFGPVVNPSIVDRDHPEQSWQRDHTKPYASADDYALIARLHDATTGSTMIVIAGLGRNGTEAGAQYLTENRYLTQLEQRLGHRLGDENVELVIRIQVVDGRTGAPSLEAAYSW